MPWRASPSTKCLNLSASQWTREIIVKNCLPSQHSSLDPLSWNWMQVPQHNLMEITWLAFQNFSGSSYSRLKYWKVLIFWVCQLFSLFPLARLLRGPCPHTLLQPLANAVLRVHPDAGRGVRGVSPEWHWGVMRGTWSPLHLVRHVSLVGKSSTFQPPESKASNLPCCPSIPIQALPCSPRALCLSSFHHGGEVSSLHSHCHHISQTSVL